MIKKTVKKSVVKKKATKKTAPTKKASPKKAATKKQSKSTATEKEKAQKEANRLIYSASKKKNSLTSKRPKKTSTKSQTTSLLDAVVQGMQEKKAKNITILNLTKLENRVSDYFVLCDADSNTHVQSIADAMVDVVTKKTGEKPYHSEGFQNAEWILVDYINIVAHVLLRDTRDYYNLEALWADAEITHIN